MAFFMQKKFKEIGHFSRVHGYKGKIVISFNSEDPSILKKNSTIWIEEFGIPSPYKIKEIQSLNKDKRILSLLNLDNKKVLVDIDKKFFRPTEVENLLGDSSKAKKKLGWYPKISFTELVAEMVRYDLKSAERDELIKRHGYTPLSYNE